MPKQSLVITFFYFWGHATCTPSLIAQCTAPSHGGGARALNRRGPLPSCEESVQRAVWLGVQGTLFLFLSHGTNKPQNNIFLYNLDINRKMMMMIKITPNPWPKRKKWKEKKVHFVPPNFYTCRGDRFLKLCLHYNFGHKWKKNEICAAFAWNWNIFYLGIQGFHES